MDFRYAISRIEKRILPFATGIYAVRPNRMPQLIGTASVIRIRDRDFIITAAHVLRSNRNKISNVFAGTHTLQPLEGGCVYRSEDVDVAIIPVEPTLHEAIADVPRLRAEDTDVNDIPAPGVLYTFTGYPSSRNKPNLREKHISNEPTLLTSMSVPLAKYKSLGITPETHIAIFFRQQRALSWGSDDNAPAPQGMSGGPVWRLGTPQDVATGVIGERVIGIGIEYRQDTLIAIRIAVAFAIIANVVPELAQLVPRPRHGTIKIRSENKDNEVS
jgi:hypothetical protein